MGNAYDYSAILNQCMPRDYSKLQKLMHEIKKLVQMTDGCKITYYLDIWGYLYDLVIECDDNPKKIVIRVIE